MIINKNWTVSALLTFAIFVGGAHAQAQTKTVDLDAILEAGRYDEARSVMLSVTRNPIELFLFEVDIAVRQGRTDDAIAMLEDALAKLPQFERARFKLASILVQDRQYDRARYQLSILRDQSDDPETSEFFAEQIEEIDGKSPFSYGFTFALTPDTNINNGSEKQFVPGFFGAESELRDNPPELQPNFGVKMELGFNGEYRHQIADHHSLLFGFSNSLNYFTYDTIDYQTARLSMNYVYEDANTRLSLGPNFSRYWGDGKTYSYNSTTDKAELFYVDEDYESLGYSMSIRHRVNSKSTISASFSHSESIYKDREEKADDNFTNIVSTTYSHQLDPRSSLYFNLAFVTYKQRGGDGEYSPPANYDSVKYGVGYRRLFESEWFVDGSLGYTRRNYSDSKYPFQDYYREDSSFSLDWQVRNQNWKIGNSVPYLNCNALSSNSNILGKSFDAFSCGVFLTNEF